MTAPRPVVASARLSLVAVFLLGVFPLAERVGHADSWYGLAGAIGYNFLWIPLLAATIPLTLLYFPDGLPSPRWRSSSGRAS